jgi:hypothetical protein
MKAGILIWVVLSMSCLWFWSCGGNDDDSSDDDSSGDDDTSGDDNEAGDDAAGGDDTTGDDDATSDDDAGEQSDPNAVWTDPSTNFVWRVNPSLDFMNQQEATSYCGGLDGGWRLPSISELRTLIRGCDATAADGLCGVNDECLSYDSCSDASCGGCSADRGPANGCYWDSSLNAIDGCLSNGWFWSSSLNEDTTDEFWDVDFDVGCVSYEWEAKTLRVRCVRSGP